MRAFIGILTLLLLPLTGLAQSKPAGSTQAIEALIVAKEQRKWDALRTGTWASVKDLYADDLISIGYAPDLTVSRRTKVDMFGRESLGQADFELSDMKFVLSNNDTAIVSFIVKGTDKTPPGPGFRIFASSVWVKRGGEWKTVFYQASLMK